ncbi:MAG: InlB B-repeat-containing protein [Lachnospiraceae bacterium]|nr:InlB B-repeat-containing protein [Lachnospiraceae bacterium]
MNKKSLTTVILTCLLVIFLGAGLACRPASAEEESVDINATFSDSGVRAALSAFDNNQDGKLDNTEIGKIKVLSLDNKTITSWNGFEKLTAVTNLSCRNCKLTSIDLSKFPNLNWLSCSNNSIAKLDLTKVPGLIELECKNNKLTSLSLTSVPNLVVLDCSGNMIPSLSLAANPGITSIRCSDNRITTLTIGTAPKLTEVICDGNRISSLSLSGCTALTTLNCTNNRLTSLSLNANTAITQLWCRQNKLSSLNVSALSELTLLDCGWNRLTSLSLNANTKLHDLYCDGNRLASLSVDSLQNLYTLRAENNRLTAIDVSSASKLNDIAIWGNPMGMLDMDFESAIAGSVCDGDAYEDIDYSYGTLSAQSISIPLRFWYAENADGDFCNYVDDPARYASVIYMADQDASNYPKNATYKSKGSVYTVPVTTVSRPGYWFMGWSDIVNSTEVLYKSNSKITLDCTKMLFPVWKLRDYKITYHLDGGTNNTANPAKYTVESPAIYLKEPTKPGYRFVGWYTDSACTKKSSGISSGSIKDREFWAKFEPLSNVLLSFDLNGGTSGAPAAVPANADGTVTVPKSSPVRENYYFMGWQNPTTGKTYKTGDTLTITASLTLKATWQAKKFKLIFDINGGDSGAPAAISAAVGSTVTVPKCPSISRAGYYFMGWADSATATTAQYKSGAQFVMEASNRTLYAVWKKK